MSKCTEIAIEENWCALALCILTKRRPKQALDYIRHGERQSVHLVCRSPVELDIGKMVEMRESGMFYREIGEVFGLTENAAYLRIYRHRLRLQAEKGVIPSDRK
jgi:hypothetical protein